VTVVLTITRTQSNTILSNSLLDDSVVEVMPLFDETLLKVVDNVDLGTVSSSL